LPYPGDVDRYYSSEQALWQGEIWSRYGRTGLARRFREAAKDADQASRSRRRMRRLAPILALGIVIAAVGLARHLPMWSTRRPTEIAVQAAAEQQSIAVRTPGAAQQLLAAEPPSPQLAVLETAAPPSPTAVPSPDALPSAPQASSTDQAPSIPSAKALTAVPSAAFNVDSMVPTASPPEPVAEPEMVSLPGDTFAMGSNFDPSEAPIHTVSIKPFAISKSVITVRA
jgi:hypothetical protein